MKKRKSIKKKAPKAAAQARADVTPQAKYKGAANQESERKHGAQGANKHKVSTKTFLGALEERERRYEAQGHREHQTRYPKDDRIEHVRAIRYGPRGYTQSKIIAEPCFRQVGDYMVDTNVLNIYGTGSFATVHPGFHKDTERNIAAKHISCQGEKISKEEISEVYILKSIPPHENIIRIFDVEIERLKSRDIVVWIITEVCDQGNLKEYTMGRDVSFNQKIHIMMQCALAVRHLHLQKPRSITHRDIKPQNILVTGDPEKPTIKLCDFGVARLVDLNHLGESATLHSMAGTYWYMAPELFSLVVDQVVPSYSKSVDVFSLGLCFLVLLKVQGLGISPFGGKMQQSLKSHFRN